MRIDKEQYDIKLVFTDKEKETLRNALNILKVIDKTFDNNEDVSYSSFEEDIIDILLEMDKYTDYICK